ncbi:MAG: PAS domain S-box protein [Dehalococcoidia bacterium]
MKTLIVTQEQETQELLEQELEKRGHSTDYFGTPDGLLQRLHEPKQEKPYNLLFIDLDMPQLNAIETLQAIIKAGFDLEVIPLYSPGNDVQLIQAIRLGIADCLTKPVSQNEIQEALSRVEQRKVYQSKRALEIGMAFKQQYAKTLEEMTNERIKRVKESETKYRATFENTGTAMAILDNDMTLSLVNREFETLYGYSKEEIEGKMKFSDFIVPEDLESIKAYYYNRITS